MRERNRPPVAVPPGQQSQQLGNARASKRTRRSGTAHDDVGTKAARLVSERKTIIPSWQKLPYHVLQEIFTYGSTPLRDAYFHPLPSIPWLLGIARLCRAFTEPALAALYSSPPVLNSSRGHKLLELLQESTEECIVDYRAKIHRLEIEVWHTLHYTCPGKGHLDLGALVLAMPQLRELELFCVDDSPMFRGKTYGSRHVYPDNIFTALEARPTRLRSWRWNSRMCKAGNPIPHIESIHQTAPFQSLRQLSFVGFNAANFFESKSSRKQEHGNVQRLAQSTHLLPNLRNLSLEACAAVNADFLEQLSERLFRLSIVACDNVSSDDLRDYLASHGSHLEELHLNHNRSLNLSFLASLGPSCPQLRVLKMDLHYFNNDPIRRTEPIYNKLLLANEKPIWPSQLQTLELAYLRQWDGDLASMFFQSLVDSAHNLSRLRNLSIKASLHIGWRDRATFRDTWIRRLEYAFLRKLAPPDPASRSVKHWEHSKNEISSGNALLARMKVDTEPVSTQPGLQGENAAAAAPGVESVPLTRAGLRRSARVSVTEAAMASSEHGQERRNTRRNGDDSLPQDRVKSESRYSTVRSTRACKMRNPGIRDMSHSDSTTSDGLSEVDREANRDYNHKNTTQPAGCEDLMYRQAMCDVVDVRIDNLRPMGVQYNENDFLDAEASGDEEWDGKEEDRTESHYAW